MRIRNNQIQCLSENEGQIGKGNTCVVQEASRARYCGCDGRGWISAWLEEGELDCSTRRVSDCATKAHERERPEKAGIRLQREGSQEQDPSAGREGISISR